MDSSSPVLERRQCTCIDDDSYSLLCVADGAAPEQQIVFVQAVSPPTAMDSVIYTMQVSFITVATQQICEDYTQSSSNLNSSFARTSLDRKLTEKVCFT